MRTAFLLAAGLALAPLTAMSQEARDPSETGLPSMARDPAREQIRTYTQSMGEPPSAVPIGAPGRVYGVELMTEVERSDYRVRLLNATTPAERERIRARHHEAMQARARERGVVLPEGPRPQREDIGQEIDPEVIGREAERQ